MKCASAIAGCLALLTLGGCDYGAPYDNQLAQQKMIGLPKRTILACMGIPVRRQRIGATEILTYPSTDVESEGGPLNLGVNGLAGPFGAQRVCHVEVILTNGAVSQIAYSGAGGGPVPIGEHCGFAVQACIQP